MPTPLMMRRWLAIDQATQLTVWPSDAFPDQYHVYVGDVYTGVASTEDLARAWRELYPEDADAHAR